MGREASEKFLGMSMDDVKSEISNIGNDSFVSNLRNRVLSRKVMVHGFCRVDDQGAMVFADRMEIMDPNPAEEAEEVMQRWGVVL